MNNKRLSITMIASIVAFVVNMGIGFLLTPYIVNNIGAESHGFVSLANNFTSYLQILTVALNSMAGRFITISITQGKTEEANRYFTSVLYANILISLILLLPVTFFILNLERFINITSNITDVKLLFVFVFLSFFVTLIGSTFAISTFVTNRKDLEAKRNTESYVIKALCIVFLFSIFKSKVFFVGIASATMTLYVFFANIHYTKKLIPQIKLKKDFFDWSKIVILIKSGIWNSISRLSTVLSSGIDLIITNLFISSAAMGILSVAKTIPAVISSLVGTVGGVFAPSYTIAYAKNDKKLLLHEMNKSIIPLSVISNACLCTLIVIGVPFFSLWVPDLNPLQLQILSIITIIGLSVNAPIQCVWNIFTITNKIKLNCIVSAVVSFVNIGIVFILLKSTTLGIYAIVSVSSVSNILKSLLFSIPYAARCINVKKRVFYIPAFKTLFSLILSTIIGSLICTFLKTISWPVLFIKGFIVVFITCLITFFVMCKKEDLQKIFKYIKRGYTNEI